MLRQAFLKGLNKPPKIKLPKLPGINLKAKRASAIQGSFKPKEYFEIDKQYKRFRKRYDFVPEGISVE